MKIKDYQGFPPIILFLLRISLGFIFLWAFLDKLFGLGFATAFGKAWINGVSPTFGFLKFAVKGTFQSIFHAMAGVAIVDWIFMLGLLGIGLAMILGVFMRLAGYAGALLMLLIWLAVLPPEHNPFLDKHIIYLLLFLGFAYADAGKIWGLEGWIKSKNK